jgi:hypothetical protein
VTFKVTGTLSLPPALAQVPVVQVKTTVPLYDPGARVLATPVIIDTVSVAPVEALVGATCSQLPPEEVVLAVYEMAVLVELPTTTVWEGGSALGL